jgi:hypothetical protein
VEFGVVKNPCLPIQGFEAISENSGKQIMRPNNNLISFLSLVVSYARYKAGCKLSSEKVIFLKKKVGG